MSLPKVHVTIYKTKIPSSGKEISYRPYQVREERALIIAAESGEESQIINAMKSTLKNCVIDEDINVDTMPIFDLQYIFLQLRSKSVGETINPSIECQNCKGKIELEINLEDVKVQTTDGHTDEVVVENGKGIIGFKMKYPTIDISEEVKKDASGFNLIVDSIEKVWDDTNTWVVNRDFTKDELSELIQTLNQSQYGKLLDFFQTMPKLKHEFKDIECKKCHNVSSYELEGLESFFA